MKIFGWKAAGRDDARPALSRSASNRWSSLGDWPSTYEPQVRDAYRRNPIAQRAVKLVAEGLASAPLNASDPALIALIAARSGGQALTETIAAHLLLHGTRQAGWTVWGWRCTRCARAASAAACRMAMRCAAAIQPGLRRWSWSRG